MTSSRVDTHNDNCAEILRLAPGLCGRVLSFKGTLMKDTKKPKGTAFGTMIKKPAKGGKK